MSEKRESLTLPPELWDRLEEIATEVGSTAQAGPTYGKPSWRSMIRRIAQGELTVSNKTDYQYWQHKRSGETYAVQLVDGRAGYINGPLHYREVEQHDPDDYHFDDPFEGDPDDYKLAHVA